MKAILCATTLLLAACGDNHGGGANDAAVGNGDLAAAAADMTTLVNGCPPFPTPQATPDGGAGGDTWASFAQGFFASYCTSCHGSNVTGAARNGAPAGYDWDIEANVVMYAAKIRDASGVENFMPPGLDLPTPSCDERHRLVRWIDAGLP